MARPGSERYPPIGDYALIGDSRACALVSRGGSLDWMCLPDFDSPSVFGRLLDWDRGGYFQIAPAGDYEVEREYIGETNVLRTTFRTATGQASVIDFMPAETEREKRRALEPLRSIFRIVEGVAGRVEMRVEYAPRPDYAAGNVYLRWRTPFEVTAARGRNVLHLRSDVPLDASRWDARATFEVRAGARRRFSLAYSYAEPAVILSDGYVDAVYDRTIAYWNAWSARCRYEGPYRQQVVRSALALKLLAYAPSGAIVAAATTSLPENIGGARNWDYRYCWIRDASFTVDAFLSLGYADEANAFVGWLMHATHQTAPRLRPLYTIHGEPNAPERELKHFEGYQRSRPVRTGNLAHNQHQFDVYGELLQAVHGFLRDQGGKVSRDESGFIAGVADYVAGHWREPDNGIWEPRIGPQQYTHSKVMAWNALQHAAAMVEAGMLRGNARRWREEAAAIGAQVFEQGYSTPCGAFTQTLSGTALDASLLMMPMVGFIAPDDSRMLSTIDAIRARLEVNGFLMRYDADDGLDAGEGAFLVCNFWLADALARAGRVDQAHAVFARTIGAANDVGLLAEQYDPGAKVALGNVPQGLSHLGLIGAALSIRDAQARAGAPTVEAKAGG